MISRFSRSLVFLPGNFATFAATLLGSFTAKIFTGRGEPLGLRGNRSMVGLEKSLSPNGLLFFRENDNPPKRLLCVSHTYL